MKLHIKPKKRKNLDQYFTPQWAIAALFEHIDPYEDALIGEPCAGRGDIVYYLDQRDRRWIASELDDNLEARDGLDIVYGVDFMDSDVDPMYQKCDWIITNPPYNTDDTTGTEIFQKAKTLAPNVACLMSMGWLEACLDRCYELPTLSKVVVVAPRVRYIGTEGRNTTPSAWCIFEKNLADRPTEIIWMDPEHGKDLKKQFKDTA